MFVGSSLIVVTIEFNCKKMVSSQRKENQWLEVTPYANKGRPPHSLAPGFRMGWPDHAVSRGMVPLHNLISSSGDPGERTQQVRSAY